MGIQEIYKNIGLYGCYYLCLLHQVDIEESAAKLYKSFIDKGWLDKDCYVKNPCALLGFITGRDYTVVKSDKPDDKADIEIQYWYNPVTGMHHFTCKDYDPLGDSNTRHQGKIESYRLFYRKR